MTGHSSRLIALALAVSAVACQVPTLERVVDGKSCDEDAGHGCAPGYQCCGGACISEDQPCCLPETDAAFCARLGKTCDPVSGTDSCGLARTANCGSCPGTSTCGGGGLPNVCGGGSCVSETNAVFCARLGKTCGTVTADDNCGLSRSVGCGSCLSPDTCQPDHTCSCSAEPDDAFCTRLGKACGSFSGTDLCGSPRTANCGACTAAPNLTCQNNACVCTPESDAQLCARVGMQCGTATGMDNCGTTRTVACPVCSSPDSCGGGGQAGQCGCIVAGSTGCLTAGTTCCEGTCNGSGKCCIALGESCTAASQCCQGTCETTLGYCCRLTGFCSDSTQCCSGFCNDATNKCE